MLKEEMYKLTIDQTIKHTNSNINGLETTEAENRLFDNGPNRLIEAKKKSLIRKFINQLKNIMIILLVIASIVSFIIAKIEQKSFVEAIVIFTVVIINALLGMFQENKAEKAIDNLKKMSAPYIKVKRDGHVESIKTEELVIGDIVIIEAGDFVPADMRIIQNNSLKIEESALTGESESVNKTLEEISNEVSLADRTNMLFSGSSVVYGRGEAVVTATGMDTELGKIANALANVKEQLTPLQKKLTEISKTLSVIVVLVGLTIGILGIVYKYSFIQIFMLSVALAVAAIPEGLPTSITIILSIGMQKMAKKNNIVRKLSSVETLGATEIICSDKTGTLTQNKMTVTEICLSNKVYKINELEKNMVKREDFLTLLKTMILCNDSKRKKDKKEYLGDPTETALVLFAEDFELEKELYDIKIPRISELPFDSVRKMMSTIHLEKKSHVIYTKGAIESILNRCKYINIAGENKILTVDMKNKILASSLEMSKKALRVLAFAYKQENQMPKKLTSEEIEQDLTFIGLVGMIDPPRPEVKEAVKKCFGAGMIPVMITGDNIDTAKAIAKDIGILNDKLEAITGMELDEMTDEEFKKRINKIRVYARVSPENKVRIVKIWKEIGKTVAMTGDGVNDAPALKTADIGIGMGITGTEVAKSVSSMVLTDDNFATIVVAIEEGRKIYNNIKKVIVYLLASNIAEITIVFFATLFNSVIFNPLQLLWINLITDTIPAITLGFEKADNNIMKQKPRESNEKLFNKALVFRILIPAVIKSIFVLLIYFFVERSPIYVHKEAMTAAFITLVLAELLFVFVVRSDRKTIIDIGIFTNPALLIGTIFTLLLQGIIIFIPTISKIFDIVALDINLYILSIGAAIIFAILSDVFKLITAKIYIKE